MNVHLCYLLEDTSLWGGVKVVFEQAEALQERGHQVEIVSKGGRPAWYDLRVPLTQVSAFSPSSLPDCDFVIGTFWTTVRAAVQAEKGRPVHLCQGYEGNLAFYAPSHHEIEAVYGLPLLTLTIHETLTRLLWQRFGKKAYTVGQGINHTIFFPDEKRSGSPPWRVLVTGPYEADVKGVHEGLSALKALETEVPLWVVRVSQFPCTAAEKSLGYGGQRVLVLAPHPDDETFGCRSALALHRRHRDPARVVFITSGELGDWQGGQDREACRTQREAEAGRTLAVLGIEEWECWRYPDRGIAADGSFIARLAEAVRAFRATLLYVPSPLEIHPDHRAVAQALRAALRGWSGKLRVAFYEVGYALPLNTLVDISAVWEVKEQASRAYESQLHGPDYLAVAQGLGRFRALTLGPQVTVAEAFRVVPVATLDSDLVWRWQALQECAHVSDRPPAVSVIVRTKDRSAFLHEALGSLAAQTFQDFEVIVVNDGGRDVSEVVAAYPRLRCTLVQLLHNQGRGAATNAGITAARGTFITYLDDDDLYYPPHLETLYTFLSQHDHFGAVYTDAAITRYRLNIDGRGYELIERRVEYSQDFDRDWLLYQNYIHNLCLMHRREGWERAGGFDASLSLLEEHERLSRRVAELEGTLERIPVPPRPPLVSILIPTKNGGRYLDEVLTAVSRQQGEVTPIEIIAVDSGSHDRTLEILQRHQVRLLHIRPEEYGHGKTRNLAVAQAHGEYLVFLTQDATPADEHWLDNLLAPLRADPLVAGAFSRHRPRPNCHPMEWHRIVAYELRSQSESQVYTAVDNPDYARNPAQYRVFANTSSVIRRAVWEQIPFPEVEFAEDQAWAERVLKAGYKTVYVANSVVVHSHSYGAWVNFRRHFEHAWAMREMFTQPRQTALQDCVPAALRMARADLAFWYHQNGQSKAQVLRRWALPAVSWHLTANFGLWIGEWADLLPDRGCRFLAYQERVKRR